MSLLKRSFLAALAIQSVSAAVHELNTRSNGTDVKSVCEQISGSITGASDVIYPLSANFSCDIHHWYVSSTQIPTCVLEAGSADDVSTAIKIIARNRTPFAIKSGGHASNPGFSSTTGVHISFNRMTQVVFNDDKSTVELGMGVIWSDLYEEIDGSGVNVVGGRTLGPGVGGFTLGGGFSWKTNQYGLTVDTVESFNLVLPNGTITTVDSSQPDLFFALKGGLNRFGIVTSAVYRTHPQTDQVYGGLAYYAADQVPAILNATVEFYKQNTDPKAQIITTLEGSGIGTTSLTLFFYDGPLKPAIFDLFDGIPAVYNGAKVQSFSQVVQEFPATLEVNIRGTFDTLSTSKLTQGFVDAVKNETDYFGSISALHSGTSISYDIEPFLDYGKHATDSAYPHSDSPLPLNLYFAWDLESEDEFWYAAMKASIERLKKVAISEGIYREEDTAYPNYAISGKTAEELYGATNAARLRQIRAEVDPEGIMELAGGFTI
ncbi:CAZyme family AA7 [Paecilomyces variotii]|nr:CAZyme family AA7 [Paecilomyces variotii]